MNYFGNPGSTYYGTPQYQSQPIMPNYYQPQIQTPQYSSITGKLVESEDMAKLQEIPIGGYGVYPLSDMSKVVIKAYDKDGNIQYHNFEIVKNSEKIMPDPYEEKFNGIFERLEKLDKKFDDYKPKKKLVEVDADE